jgi:hypothetical protein
MPTNMWIILIETFFIYLTVLNLNYKLLIILSIYIAFISYFL